MRGIVVLPYLRFNGPPVVETTKDFSMKKSLLGSWALWLRLKFPAWWQDQHFQMSGPFCFHCISQKKTLRLKLNDNDIPWKHALLWVIPAMAFQGLYSDSDTYFVNISRSAAWYAFWSEPTRHKKWLEASTHSQEGRAKVAPPWRCEWFLWTTLW